MRVAPLLCLTLAFALVFHHRERQKIDAIFKITKVEEMP